MLWNIRFNVFVSGAIVMALELVGSRLLAPSFGDSIFVWGSLIGVVMASLAIGYYTGGKLADRNPSYRTFSLIILSAGFLIILIPMSSPLVLEAVFYSGLGERYGPVLASLLLLSLPTSLLGMVSPYSIKMVAENILTVGGISGSLYSISTGGSIFGTFFTVFVLIPQFGVRQIIISLGFVLILVALIGLTWMERAFSIIMAILLTTPSFFISGGVFGPSGTVIHQTDTAYNTLTVLDQQEKGIRILYLNNLPHSGMYLNGSSRAAFTYTDYFNMAFLFNPEADRVLFIGGGGFSGPKQFFVYYPEIYIDVVEIDPIVVEIAEEYFSLPKDERLEAFVEDGRQFLKKSGEYDVVILDAYSKTYVPFHLMTKEFFQTLYSHLSENGVVVSNLISSLIGDTSNLLMSEYNTVREVFPQAYLFYTRSSSLSTIQNIILIATKNPANLTRSDLIEMAKNYSNKRVPIKKYVNNLHEPDLELTETFLLTDDYAPTERLLNPITLAPYEGGERIIPRNSLNPYLISGIWVIALASLYIVIVIMKGRLDA
jgi:spermidine synthase